MGTAFWALAAVTVVALGLAAALGFLLVVDRRRLRDMLTASRAETASLQERLDELASRVAVSRAGEPATPPAEFVITDMGRALANRRVADQVVLSTAVGEPLVKVAAFGHGVRRALSAESRNRIFFEMRREVRRARKHRRREMKQAWRRFQAEQRAEDPDGTEDAA